MYGVLMCRLDGRRHVRVDDDSGIAPASVDINGPLLMFLDQFTG